MLGLHLNLPKMVVVSLWSQGLGQSRRRLLQCLPAWKDLVVDYLAKYLRYWLGPDAGNRSWNDLLRKNGEKAAVGPA